MSYKLRILWVSLILSLVSACGGGSGGGSQDSGSVVDPPPVATSWTPDVRIGADCVEGFADEFPCRNIDLLSVMQFDMDASDIWGWTDSVDGSEYALLGLMEGTAFINITNPDAPFLSGYLETLTTESSWRDIKVYDDHAFIVSEAENFGLQIFDLTRLRGVVDTIKFTEDAHYNEFGDAHNIAINEESGYAYVAGSDSCQGGLHMVDILNPQRPVFAGCVSEEGYTHDAQCVIYHGLDFNYQGREICFNANEDSLVIIDVSDKSNPLLISKTGYSGFGYTHQGWLTGDHDYFLLGDEGDEIDYGHKTRTYIWDLSDLKFPFITAPFTADTEAIDHNLYVHGNHIFQANYTAGIRVLRSGNLSLPELAEVAFFDTYPPDDAANFFGTWSVYPYFDSGVIIASDIETGLFILNPHLDAVPQCQDGLDNDADGFTDFPSDFSCNGEASLSED